MPALAALRVPVAAVLATALALPLLPGCGEQKKKSEVRAEEAAATLQETLEARRKRVLAALPAEDDGGDEEHPWQAWIKRAVAVTPSNDLKKVALKAKGGPLQDQAESLARFYEAQKSFYLEEKIEPNEYMRELITAANGAKGQPWELDLEFEKLFFHAGLLAHPRAWTLFASDPHDDRVTNFFTYWKYAFDWAPKTAIFEDEVNVLCKERLGDYCKDMPMEERPFQVMRKYYERVAQLVDEYKTKYPSSPYNPFLDRIAAEYRKRATQVPTYEEFPVLPSIRSTIAAPIGGNAVLWVTKKGVMLMDNVLRAPDKPEQPWQPDWSAPDPKLPEAVSALVQDVRSSTVSQFNQSMIMVVPEADVPVRYLESILRATILGENAKNWPTVMLVGRRRADGSNRRAGYAVSILAKDKAVPFTIKAPAASGKGGAKQQCTAWAVVGKELYEAKGFSPVVFHDGQQVHAGRLAPDGTIQSVQSAPGHGDGDRLQAWADGQTTSIVVAVKEGLPYANWLEALNGVALRCDNDECNLPRTQPVFLATCR